MDMHPSVDALPRFSTSPEKYCKNMDSFHTVHGLSDWFERTMEPTR